MGPRRLSGALLTSQPRFDRERGRGRDGVARVDLAYPGRRIAVALDGFSWHSSRTAFVSDRNRQNRLVLLGWTVLRFTWADVVDNPESVVALLSQALAA